MEWTEDAVLAAESMFAIASGRKPDEGDEIDISLAGFENVDPQTLALDLQAWTESPEGQESKLRGTAYWALGKRFDPGLLGFFRDALARELERDPGILFQIMIALDNLREPIFSRERKGYSVLDEELNRADAKAYLTGHP